jgi:hypothetical protein
MGVRGDAIAGRFNAAGILVPLETGIRAAGSGTA